MTFPSLSYPTPWPPPRHQRHWLSRIPFIGWLIGGLYEGLTAYRDPPRRQIELQITTQLESRPEANADWPVDLAQRRVVDLLAGIICVEKCLSVDRVALHPDDPLELLMWGPFDDITPMVLRLGMDDLFGRRISTEVMRLIAPPACSADRASPGFLTSSLTLRNLVDHFGVQWANQPPDHDYSLLPDYDPFTRKGVPGPWWDRIPTKVGFAIIFGFVITMVLLLTVTAR